MKGKHSMVLSATGEFLSRPFRQRVVNNLIVVAPKPPLFRSTAYTLASGLMLHNILKKIYGGSKMPKHSQDTLKMLSGAKKNLPLLAGALALIAGISACSNNKKNEEALPQTQGQIPQYIALKR